MICGDETFAQQNFQSVKIRAYFFGLVSNVSKVIIFFIFSNINFCAQSNTRDPQYFLCFTPFVFHRNELIFDRYSVCFPFCGGFDEGAMRFAIFEDPNSHFLTIRRFGFACDFFRGCGPNIASN